MTEPSQSEFKGVANQVRLRTALGVLAITCGMLTITRSSPVASMMVVVAVLLALASGFLRPMRGQIVVPLLIALHVVIFVVVFAILYSFAPMITWP